MPGTLPPFIVAEALLIMAGKFLLVIAPLLTVLALWWLVNQTERIVHGFFPYLEWEHRLGWLNIKAERRAKTALRWVGYGVYLLLAAALPGAAWGAVGVRQVVDQWSDPPLSWDIALRFLALAFCLGLWWLYLGCWLVPKMRAEREEKALRKFRAEMHEIEREGEEREPPSRLHRSLPRPRTNAPGPLMPNRAWKSRRPGGPGE